MKRALLLCLTLLTVGTSAVVWQSSTALAASKDKICEGVGLASGDTGCADSSGSLQKIVDAVINIFSMIIGVVAVIMIMLGGFKFITAGGDSGKVSSARNTIMYAVIGLVVVAFAQFLVRFVIYKTK